ncbi:hypothetical protein fugu_005724 [Takifugu bimaculatus]|uniref:PH domain-containing protein n=1 Tax=Takifugu bimaculatus TaxID=433685 RepID=A0A4Z2B564_9TELE|nr:hypothetical protein fugu_005724 [Takifugu bimaculatus]
MTGVASNMAVVKSGWLHRQSTILRRWKKNWFDLWSDGRLVFYNDQQRRDMEDDLHMRLDCINIRNSAACHADCHSTGRLCARGDGIRSSPLLRIWPPTSGLRSRSVWGLRYTSTTLHRRSFTLRTGRPYPGAYPYHYQGGYVAPGVNHVVIQERQRENGGDVALGMLAGAATGLALGSLFSVF